MSPSKRPTIADLARAANVSISTVDRVINGRYPVRKPLADRVLAAAQEIGYHGIGALRQRVGGERRPRKLGFLLLQKERPFYQILAEVLTAATQAAPAIRGTARIAHVDDLDPASVAAKIEAIGREVDALAIVAANHAHVSAAIAGVHARNVPVFALISELTAPVPVGFAGLDNFRVGRTAAWAIANFCRLPGKVATIVGSHRFRCQDLNEMGFRSYFRENVPNFSLLEPVASFEDARFAAELARELVTRVPDLVGLYVAGGGISGVITSLRENEVFRRIVTIGHDVTPATKSGLVDGVLRLVIAHPVRELARVLVDAMAKACLDRDQTALPAHIVPFDIVTPENV